MISVRHAQEFCKDDISEIENYEEAVSDMLSLWHCHHRAETNQNKTKQELIDNGLYYNRPAEELVFIRAKEHLVLHQTGRKNNFFGRHHDEETKARISDKMSKIMIGNTHGKGCKGKSFTETHKANIKKSKTGCKRYNDGKKNFFMKPEKAAELNLKEGWLKNDRKQS